jgi:hypothetical protein
LRTERGIVHFVAHRYAEAVAAFRHRPNLSFFCHAYLAACHAQLGEDAAMRGAAAEVLHLRSDFSVAVFTSNESHKLAAIKNVLRGACARRGSHFCFGSRLFKNTGAISRTAIVQARSSRTLLFEPIFAVPALE